MNSILQINFNFRKAMRQADKLDSIAKDMLRVATGDLSQSIQTLGGNWAGKSADAFLAKEGRAQDNVRKLSSNLSGIASSLRQMSRAIYQAELEAVRIAQKRDS